MLNSIEVERLQGVRKEGPRIYLGTTVENWPLRVEFDYGKVVAFVTTQQGGDPRQGLCVAELTLPGKAGERTLTDAELIDALEQAGWSFKGKSRIVAAGC